MKIRTGIAALGLAFSPLALPAPAQAATGFYSGCHLGVKGQQRVSIKIHGYPIPGGWDVMGATRALRARNVGQPRLARSDSNHALVHVRRYSASDGQAGWTDMAWSNGHIVKAVVWLNTHPRLSRTLRARVVKHELWHAYCGVHIRSGPSIVRPIINNCTNNPSSDDWRRMRGNYANW